MKSLFFDKTTVVIYNKAPRSDSIMERKKTWYELSEDEKTTLLIFWFRYYGGMVFTMDEYDQFIKLAQRRQDDIFAHIVTRAITEDTMQSNVLLQQMRNRKVEDLFKTSYKRSKLPEDLMNYFDYVAGNITDQMMRDYESSVDEPISFMIVIADEDKHEKQ